jgi:hypothetical protein
VLTWSGPDPSCCQVAGSWSKMAASTCRVCPVFRGRRWSCSGRWRCRRLRRPRPTWCGRTDSPWPVTVNHRLSREQNVMRCLMSWDVSHHPLKNVSTLQNNYIPPNAAIVKNVTFAWNPLADRIYAQPITDDQKLQRPTMIGWQDDHEVQSHTRPVFKLLYTVVTKNTKYIYLMKSYIRIYNIKKVFAAD